LSIVLISLKYRLFIESDKSLLDCSITNAFSEENAHILRHRNQNVLPRILVDRAPLSNHLVDQHREE
jgi:hypothetical protein